MRRRRIGKDKNRKDQCDLVVVFPLAMRADLATVLVVSYKSTR